MLKRLRWLGVGVALAAALAPMAAQALTAYDTSLLYRQLQIVMNHVNNIRDTDDIKTVVVNAGLLTNIDKRVVGKSVQFNQTVTTIREIAPNHVRIEGTFTAQGTADKQVWHNHGNDYFVFDNKANRWQLSDTNFYQLIGVDAARSQHETQVAWAVFALLAVGLFVWWRWRPELKLQRRARGRANHSQSHHQPVAPQFHQPEVPDSPSAVPSTDHTLDLRQPPPSDEHEG